MDCQVCGTQLPSGARACPHCGTLAPASSPNASASPYDPTIPAVSASSPFGLKTPPPPPTQYGANSYDSSLPGPYPANPYEIPARPKRSHIGLIVGIAILILLLIGGGVFGWHLYSSANAPATFTANGTFTITNTTTTNVQQNGQDKIYSNTQQGENAGDLSGSFTQTETLTLHPDNTSDFSGTDTCTCTVAGKSGTLQYSITGTSTASGSFQGQIFNFQGTGDLANLHGQGVFQGQGSQGVYQGTYSDQLHFDT